MNTKKIPALFRKHAALVAAVKQDHVDNGAVGKGHDFLHAVRVANVAYEIAFTETLHRRALEWAWICGILHNTDHLFGEKAVRVNLERYLALTELLPGEIAAIMHAVENHSKKNSPEVPPLLQFLMDADKVVCLEADVIVRAGQFMCHLPMFDPRYVNTPDPEATYRNPKTVLRDIEGVLEWVDDPNKWFFTQTARRMAQERGALIRIFVNTLKQQIRDAGLTDQKLVSILT